MKVRLLVDWNGNRAGSELVLDDGPGQVLVETGKAVEVVQRPGKVQPQEVKSGSKL